MSDLISRQQAIDALRAMQTYKMFAGDDLLLIDQAGAQTELMMLQSAQPEEIALHESCTSCPLYDKDRHKCPRFNKVIPEALRELQPAQPERKKGEWTKDGACQFCGFQPWYERDIHTLSFCPNCGADMREQKLQYADEETAQSGLMSAT